MELSEPHRGRTFQEQELLRTLWMVDEECTLNLTLYNHLVNLGWKFQD